ncbi:PLD nuclease N-terminal domain-containing protein [Ekhidna sp.]
MSNWTYLAVFAAAIAVYSMINILMASFSINKKMVWFAIVALIPILGPLVYLFSKTAIEANSKEAKD